MNYYIGEAAGKVYEFLADQKNNEATISKISKELSVEQSFIQIISISPNVWFTHELKHLSKYFSTLYIGIIIETAGILNYFMTEIT